MFIFHFVLLLSSGVVAGQSVGEEMFWGTIRPCVITNGWCVLMEEHLQIERRQRKINYLIFKVKNSGNGNLGTHKM
jgi:hypothetical protein